jgi:hypothetical protein
LHALHGAGLFLAAAIGIGLFLSSLVATMQQATLFSSLAILLCDPLGPHNSGRDHADGAPYFTYLNPLRYAIEITQCGYLGSVTLGQLIPDLWPLAVIDTPITHGFSHGFWCMAFSWGRPRHLLEIPVAISYNR